MLDQNLIIQTELQFLAQYRSKVPRHQLNSNYTSVGDGSGYSDSSDCEWREVGHFIWEIKLSLGQRQW